MLSSYSIANDQSQLDTTTQNCEFVLQNLDQPIALDGHWCFYWNKLISPDQFGQETPDANVRVPDSWTEYQHN